MNLERPRHDTAIFLYSATAGYICRTDSNKDWIEQVKVIKKEKLAASGE